MIPALLLPSKSHEISIVAHANLELCRKFWKCVSSLAKSTQYTGITFTFLLEALWSVFYMQNIDTSQINFCVWYES